MLVKGNGYKLTENLNDLTLTQIQAYEAMNIIASEIEKESSEGND